MFRALLLLPLVALASCNPCCFAQITMTEQKVQVITGITSPQIVGEALLIGADSKPVFATAAIIEATAEQQKMVTLEALRIPTLEPGEVNQAGPNRWLLVGSGSYLVTAYASDPGFQIKHLKVDLGVPPGPGPGPGPPPGPAPDELSPVATASREALQAYVQAMAGDFEQLAAEAKLGKFKTILDAEKASVPRDQKSRDDFKRLMGKVMGEAIGSGPQLPESAAQTFSDIATGFRGVR